MKKLLMTKEKYEELKSIVESKVKTYNSYLSGNYEPDKVKNLIRFSYAMEFRDNPSEKEVRCILNEICAIYDVPMILFLNNSIVTFCNDEIYITTKPLENFKKNSCVVIKQCDKDSLRDDPIHLLSEGISVRKLRKMMKKM